MLKTPKIITKRIKLKPKSKKGIRKSSYQSHYNSKDTGNARRKKRRTQSLDRKSVKKLLSLVK